VIIPARWFVEPVAVETYAGSGAYGDEFAAAVTVLGHVTAGRNAAGGLRVKGSASGDEVVSQMRVLLPNPARLADGSGTVDPTTLLTPESRVTSGAVVATVEQVEEHRQPGTGAVVYVSGVLG
jgi:hypothetical protein